MDFSLEDILREFGSGDTAPADTQPPEAPPPADGSQKDAARAGETDAEAPSAPEEKAAAPADVPADPPGTSGGAAKKPEPASKPAGTDGQDADEDFSSDFWQSIRRAPRLKEDGESAPESPAVPPAGSAPAGADDTDEDLKIFYENPDYIKKPKVKTDLGTTRRFVVTDPAECSDAPSGDTIRLDGAAVAAAAGAGAGGSTASDSGETAPGAESGANKPTEGAEPFSKNWEPHYDEPMGEYVPPEPIVFRPRSRLRELKKKLVAGPERRYYALAEEGLGKYQISIFLGLLVVILSAAAVVLHQMGLVQENRMRLLVFGELFTMLFAALLGSDRLMEGFLSIFKGRFTLDSLLTATFIVCVVDGVYCLQEVRVPFSAAFCLEMVFSLWAEFERRNTEMGQMDTMRKATRLNRVAKAPDCYEGRPGFYTTDGEVEDFMETYDLPSAPGKAMNLYALAAFVLSGVIGLVSGLRDGVAAGFQTWSVALLAAAPVTAFICQSRPMAVLERRLHKLGVVLCGWQGVKAACGSSVILLSDSDLFPSGSVKVNGVKFYSQRDPDQTVAYATALIEASGMGIANLFTQLRDSRYARHYTVENFRCYENGGIGGEVCGEPVLVGSLTFLQEMGVELPEGARVSQAVYAAVDGELCGVFAMAFGRLKGVSAALGTLCGYRRLTPVLVTENFLLSESFIRAKFNANTRRFAFPSLAERKELVKWTPDLEKSAACALTTQEGLAGVGFAITGARALRSAVNMGTWMHILWGLVSMAVVAVLTLAEGGAALLTPANLLLLELIWALPGLLITEWTRRL